MMRQPYYYAHRGGDGFGGLIFFIIGLVFWIAVVVGVVLLINHLLQRHNQSQPSADPVEIAKARYARGEISKEEFTQLKKDLS